MIHRNDVICKTESSKIKVDLEKFNSLKLISKLNCLPEMKNEKLIVFLNLLEHEYGYFCSANKLRVDK